MDALEARLLDGTPLLSPEAVVAFRAHAIECYPEECFGIIDRARAYVAMVNVSPLPRQNAHPAKGLLPAYSAEGNLRAICHSHPDGLDCPSEPDMFQQREWAIPFVLVATNGEATTEPFAWGDQLLDETDLVGRPFRHGVTDCYALVRAYYLREQNVLLPNVPRNWEWWSDRTSGSKDLYLRYFRKAGFYEIDPREVGPGDGWLATIRSDTPNHAGVVLDAGLCLHHPSGGQAFDPGRLSKREPLLRMAPHVTHWVRRRR